MAIARLFDFQPATVIQSSQVDAEFNQLCELLNGTSTDKDVILKLSHAANPVLTVDQTSTGPIQSWKQAGAEVVSIRNNGALRIKSDQAISGSGAALALNNTNALNVPGAGLVATIETVGTSQIALRLALEGATVAGIPAMQVTKIISGSAVGFVNIRNSGEIRVSPGYPVAMADNPAVSVGAAVTLGGQYLQNVTAAGNVGSGEDDLHSLTIAANVLANDGDSLDFISSGTFAANGNNKRVKTYFGGTVVQDTGTVAFNNLSWCLRTTITRLTSTTANVATLFSVTDNAHSWGYSVTVTSLDFTNTIILKNTGEATSNNDIVNIASIVRKFARAQ